MAKFYSRYFAAAATPAPSMHNIFYGYRGTNYVVNGQFYTAATNVKQTDNFQQNSACTECQQRLAPLVVDSVFEPGLIANSFDLLGSKLPSEFAAGQFQTYGTWRGDREDWSFKGMQSFIPQCFCVNTSNATANLEGCVLTGSTCHCCVTPYQLCSTSGCSTCYYNCHNYRIIEKPTGTFNCFVPITLGAFNACNNCFGFNYSCLCYPEATFGNTGTAYYSAGPVSSNCICCQCYCSWVAGTCQMYWCGVAWGNACHCCAQTSGMSYSQLQYHFGWERTSGGNNTSFYNNNFTGQADGHVFGSGACKWMHCAAPQIYGNLCSLGYHVFGGHPYYNGGGSPNESGVRVFLSRGTSYSFYLLHDAANGGIQGADVSTVAVSRLQLKVFDHSTNTSTTLTTFKKGVSGLVIPSQPDQDTTSSYRFYMMTFNGADTASQTISIYRPDLNLASGSATIGSAYTLTMTTAEQQALYADLGHNNTGASVWDNANFRRQTVNRIWYSTDANGVKRLHLGIYNTNGSGVVTGSNGFSDSANRGKMFQIYSWSLNDGTTSATYLGKVNLATYAPRYFFPLDNNWRIIYSGSSFMNDIILSLNQTTGLYQYQNTMPYIAPRLFKDREGRWATQIVDYSVATCCVTSVLVPSSNGTAYSNYIDILTSDVGQTLVITANNTSFTYTGSTINSNVSVNVYDYLGNRIAKQVTLSIVGATATPGVTFSGGAYSTTVNTSNSADTVVAVQIISSTSAKVIGTVTESL